MSADLQAETRVAALTAGEADPAFRRRAAWALSRLELCDGDRLLEVGAGLGSLLILAEQIAAIAPVAVDVDLRRLAVARRLGYRGACVVGDAAALPFRPAAFDRALACEVLEHLDDDAGALRELRRVCRTTARLAVTVPNARYPASWDPLAWLLERIGVQPPRGGLYVGIWTGHRRLYERDRLRDLCTRAGWSVVDDALLVRGSLPFGHFLLYGLGKRLLEAGLVGRRVAAAVGRRAGAAGLPPLWHPVGLAIRLVRACDDRAERRARPETPSVHLALLLTPVTR